jgi:hypothetical protein
VWALWGVDHFEAYRGLPLAEVVAVTDLHPGARKRSPGGSAFHTGSRASKICDSLTFKQYRWHTRPRHWLIPAKYLARGSMRARRCAHATL